MLCDRCIHIHVHAVQDMVVTFHIVRVGVGAQSASIESSKFDQTTDRSYGIGTGSCSEYKNVVHILYITVGSVFDNPTTMLY